MDGIRYGTRTTRSNSNPSSMLAPMNNADVNGSGIGSSNDQASTSTATEAAGPICANCSTQTTSLWRRSAEGQTLCNACSLYQKMKGTPRPVSLKSDTIKHRNRSKGEKKVKDPTQTSKGSGKGKKAAGGSRAASVNRASKPSSPAMRDVLEVDDEAYESHEELLGMDSGNTSTASMHDALLVSQINARHGQKSPGTDQQQDPNQYAGTSEYAAAAALASASAGANASGKRSVSVDGRWPTSHRALIEQSHQLSPLGPSLYNHYAYPSATPSSLFNGYTLGHQHMIPPILHPGYRTDIKNIYPYPPQQSVDAMNPVYFPPHRDLGHSQHISGHTKSQSPSASTSRNSSPRLANARLPAAAVRQSSQSRQNSPQIQDAQFSSALALQHTSQQISSPYTSTPSVPSAAGPHRSASLDRYGVRHHSVVDRLADLSEDSRSRPVAATAKSGDSINGQEQESLSGRSSLAHPGSTSYHPYNLPLQRSQQRGMQNGPDTRASAGLRGRTSPGTFKQVRPGSSASSSSGSNDELKKGPASIYSPPFHPSISPNLPPIADAMVIDEEEAETAQILGQAARQSSSAERRGRSTTRKTRDGDTVAYGLSALRVRSSSRGDDDDRTQSPPFTKLTHSSNIMVADLDDGIVRNAVTHRPISDMRDSASPGTTTLPSLSSALSSTASSRSASGSRSTSRQSRKVLLATHASSGAPLLPPPNTGYEEVARLRTRIQELEFINSLLENRVTELEAAKTPPVHSPSCSCRCSQSSMDEDARLSERFREELASHGIQGLGDKENKELFELLHQRLGYQPGDLSK